MLAQFCEPPRKALEGEDEVVTTIFDRKSAFIAVCLGFGTAAMIWNSKMQRFERVESVLTGRPIA